MEHIILPSVSETKGKANTSVFKVSPLFPGYGHTVGNSLRRALLSSLPGAAVTNVRIEGGDHEFSTVAGVKEDIVEIILNLKSLRLEMHETEEPVTLMLQAKGPKNVTAKDFKANSKITIANPEMHIATLSGKANLNLEATIEYGRGYDPVEKRETKSRELGVIAIDSLFNPVQSVSIEVENTRVGKMTNYDELHLTITTDGTISPNEAFKAAAGILVDQFHLLATHDAVREVTTESESTEGTEAAPETELVTAGLSLKIARILAENGYGTLEALRGADADALKQVSGLGPKALTEIEKIR